MSTTAKTDLIDTRAHSPSVAERLRRYIVDAVASYRARAEDRCRIQGRARSRLRLLRDRQEEAGAADDEDEGRRQGFPDRAALDDQPLSNPQDNERRSP